MATSEEPRIGNRCDAIDLLEHLIETARIDACAGKDLIPGLEALKDVLVREAI